MKKGLIIGIVVAILVIGLGAYLLMGNSKTSVSPNESPDLPTKAITINNFAFSPATLTINKGETVVWTNSDPMAHTVTSDSGSELSSGTLSKGQTYSHTFNDAGTYNYHCNFHSSMKATIIVK